MHTLVYVDKELATAMAVKLVGLQSEETRTRGVGGSFNWIIQANVADESSSSISVDIRELLPEDVMYRVYDALEPSYKFDNLSNAITRLSQTGDHALLPGQPISVTGTLSFPSITRTGPYDPFNPPDLTVPTFLVHGERCFAGTLTGDGFHLPVYFPEPAKVQVAFCHEEPVEVTGIVRWSPPYSPKGGRALSLIIRAAAVWLR